MFGLQILLWGFWPKSPFLGISQVRDPPPVGSQNTYMQVKILNRQSQMTINYTQRSVKAMGSDFPVIQGSWKRSRH